MDVESRSRWEQYTKAKEAMLERTHIAEAPWHVVQAVDKKKARLNCIAHLLDQIPYAEIGRDPVVLPAANSQPGLQPWSNSARNVRAGALLGEDGARAPKQPS